MKHKLLIPGLMIFLGLLAASCNKTDRPKVDCATAGSTPQSGGIAPGGCIPPQGDSCNTGCDNGVCTTEFASVNLRVTDASSAPVALDSFAVTDGAGNPFLMPYGILPGGCVMPGTYQLVNDGWVPGHRNTTQPVRARGYKGGVLVVNQVVIIGADCCHVKRVSGPETVVASN